MPWLNESGTIYFTDLGYTTCSSGIWGENIWTLSGGKIIYCTTRINSNSSVDWTTSPTPGASEVDFETVMIHEFGHWFGLYDLYNLTSTMGYTPCGFARRYITTDANFCVSLLCSPTGIEDGILISLTNSLFNVNQTYFGQNTRNFIDYEPYGDYITEWYSWKITASSSCGEILVFETSSSGYINIPSLPSGYNWVRDQNGDVLATISTSGMDNSGHIHYTYESITIGNVPNTFITSGTLTSDTYWCGVINITSDITVPQNITLSIFPGTYVVFNNSSSLNVNGTLTANGTPTNKITFDFMTSNSYSQNGIKINSGDGINLSHAIIKNAYAGITYNIKNGDQYSISNSTIEDCSNGIILEYGNKDGGLTVTNNTLQNISGTGIKITNPGYGMNDEVSITNNTLSNCTNGIYVYYASPIINYNHILEPIQNGIYVDASGQSPLICHNEIKKSSSNPQYRQYQGIWIVNNSTAYLAHNDVQGFYWGIYCGGGSQGYFTDYGYSTYNPNNRFKDNQRGISAAWGSYLLAGSSSLGLGYNSIHSNTYKAAYIYQYSNAVAEVNYWGGGTPNFYVDATSSFTYSGYLSQDPWSGQSSAIVIGDDIPNPSKFNKTTESQTSASNIEEAISLEKSGKIQEAVEYYKKMINEEISVELALTSLLRLRNMYNIVGVKEYYENLFTTAKSQDRTTVLKLLGDLQLSQNNANAAISVYDNIIKTNNDAYSVTKAKFSKLFAILNIKKDVKAALQILNEIKSSGVKEEDQLMLLEFAAYLINSTVIEKSFGNDEGNNLVASHEKPTEFRLLSNFPNPFNPSTTISYALPVESDVQIVIYDLIGGIVKTLISNSQSAGYKTAFWDGRNDFGEYVSSGIYIYSIKAISIYGDGRSFTKSSKLVLMK